MYGPYIWCAFGPRKASKVEKSVFCTNKSPWFTSSVHPRLCALCSYLCVCVCVCVCLCVCVSNLLVLLLIIGWLPHHCPFPEVGPYTQTFSVSSSYVLTWLVNKWHQRHGTGSLKDNPYWYFLECSHVVSIDYQKNQVHPCFNMSMPQTPQKRMTASQQLETSQPRVSRRW